MYAEYFSGEQAIDLPHTLVIVHVSSEVGAIWGFLYVFSLHRPERSLYFLDASLVLRGGSGG